MRRRLLNNSMAMIIGGIVAGLMTVIAQGQEMPQEYGNVLKYLGRGGDYGDNVLKVNIPRNDLKISVDGVSLPTPFGFGGWISMTKGEMGNDVMMGDLVLLQQEVNPIMSALLDHGLEVSALHNHFFYDEPRLFYMHVHGYGKPEDLAHAVRPALDLIGHEAQPGSSDRPGARASDVVAGNLNTANIAEIVGHKGDMFGRSIKSPLGVAIFT